MKFIKVSFKCVQVIFVGLVIMIGSQRVLAIDQTVMNDVPLSDWMAAIKDDTPLNRLSIPGTHDTMAFKGSNITGYVRTQDRQLENQLNSGIRYVDIRIDSRMRLVHGYIDLKSKLDKDVLAVLQKFLDEHPTEVIVARMAHERYEENPIRFKERITSVISKYEAKDLFAVNPSTTSSIGSLRGKVVVIDNTGSTGGPTSFYSRGLAVANWNENIIDKQDNYDKPKLSNKRRYVIEQVNNSTDSLKSKNETRMFVNHLSATKVIGKTPRSYAKDMNPWFDGWLKTPIINGQRVDVENHLGIMIFDFFDTFKGINSADAVRRHNNGYFQTIDN